MLLCAACKAANKAEEMICDAVEQGFRGRTVKIVGGNGRIRRRNTSMGKGQGEDLCRKARENTASAAPETA